MTIIFVDIVDSTRLGRRFDPETFRRVMALYFERTREILERHGGLVEKFIGDAVMAVFGVPQVHEDDALRAVRAAAEMCHSLPALGEELERKWGIRFAARIGVNTGEVAVGDWTLGQSLVAGDAVNAASKLQQAASPNDALIGESTHRLVRNSIKCEEVALPGLESGELGMRAFRLVALEPPTEAESRLTSPLVGRADELALLEHSLARTIRERSCHLFTILGPPGVGKSRLAAEVLSPLQDSVTVLHGRCLPYGEGITYWPVREVVGQAADIRPDDPPGKAQDKIAAVLGDDASADVIAQTVSGVIGLKGGSAAPEEAFWSVRRLFECIAHRQPLIIVLDDLNWAEPAMLDLIEHVADLSRDAPMLLMCLGRAELLESRPGWGGGMLNATSISLQPLDGSECDQLIGHLLDGGELSDRARALITEATGGNPLFVEETLSMLIDEGTLQRRDEGWAAVQDSVEISVPPTIHALLSARLDHLPAAERLLLERASVIGKSFRLRALTALCEAAEPAEVEHGVEELVRKDLVRVEASNTNGDKAYGFRHMLIRDVAYWELSKDARAELHQRFAGWLEEASGKWPIEAEEIIGYHLEQAFLYRKELEPSLRESELGSRAAERLASAGSRAYARGDMRAAVNLWTRARSLLAPRDARRVQLAPDLGMALFEVGELQKAEALLAEALGETERHPDAAARARITVTHLQVQLMTEPEGKTDEALSEARAAIEILEQDGDDDGLAKSWSLVAAAHWNLGHAAQTEEALHEAIEHARRCEDAWDEAEDLCWMLASLFWGPTEVEEGLRRCNEVLERTGSNRKVESMVLRASGAFHAMLGRFDEGRSLVDRGIEILEDLGLRVATATSSEFAGYLEMLAGEPEAAERRLLGGFRMLQQMGEKGVLSNLSAHIAHALCAQGRYDEARSFVDISARTADREDVISQALWRAAQGKILAHQGNAEYGFSLAGTAVDLARGTDFLNLHADALMDMAEVLTLGTRTSEARLVIEEALRLYENKGNAISLRRARELLPQ